MFSLDSRDFSEGQFSMDTVKEWAGEIANSYFNAAVEPTHTLKKIAQSEELSPHQVFVVASEANKLIHNNKYASADEKYFAAEFPLADAQLIVKELQLDGGETKVAAEFPRPKIVDNNPDPYEMWGVKPEAFDKTASIRGDLKVASVKTELLQQKLQDKVIIIEHQKIAAEKAFIKTARQSMLDEPGSANRMKILGYLDHFVKSAELPAGKRLLAKLAHVLKREGKLEPTHAKTAMEYFMSKTADEKAPDELISETLPAKIVNGKHPLYVTLKTVCDREADLLRFQRESVIVDDKLKLIKQRIRAL